MNLLLIICLISSGISLLFVFGAVFWMVSFHRWTVKELRKKLHLNEGEQLRVVQLKFGDNVQVCRADTGEPMDVVYLVEYSNTANKNGVING